MTKDQALAILNLPPEASRHDIDAAFSRLVRRYPPEFQPEKFRRIDEAYRFLTSLGARLEVLLTPEKTASGPPGGHAVPTLTLPPADASLRDKALVEIRRRARLTWLWSPPQ